MKRKKCKKALRMRTVTELHNHILDCATCMSSLSEATQKKVWLITGENVTVETVKKEDTLKKEEW